MGETGLIVIEFLPNLRDFPICRMDPKRDTYHVSKCHWFRQACTYLKWDMNLPYKKQRRDLAMTSPTVRRACNTCSWIIRFLDETKKNSNIK